MLTFYMYICTLYPEEVEMEEKKLARVLADIEPELKKRLFRVLLEEDMTFSEWLRRQIDCYLKEKEPSRRKKRKPGKGA
jgi:hypothetical protein